MARANFPPNEIATIIAKGAAYSNWKTVRVDFEVGRAWAEFQFTAVEAIEVINNQFGNLSGMQLWPRDNVEILLGGRPIAGAGDTSAPFIGIIEVRQSAFTATEHAVMLFGRDPTKNAVDSSAQFDDGKGQFIEQTFSEIAPVILATVCVKFSAPHGDNGYRYPYFAVAPGETPWAAVERLMRFQPGMRAFTDGNGTLVCDFVSGAGPIDANTVFAPPSAGFEFIEGKNILQSTATIDITKSMGRIEVRAQQPTTDSNSSSGATLCRGFATDPTPGDPCRYKLEMSEEPATNDGCTLRARHEITVVAQEVVHCTVKVYGWFSKSGRNFSIYTPYLVWSPSHNLFRTLWSRKVTFEQNDQDGSTTTLELCTFDALNPTGIRPPSARPLPETRGALDGPFFGQGVPETNFINQTPVEQGVTSG